MINTVQVWFCATKLNEEATAPGFWVWLHVQHHDVGGGDERAGPKRAAKATQLLRHVRVTVMYVQEIISALSVSLEIKDPEGQRDHIAFWDLTETCLVLITVTIIKLSAGIKVQSCV